MTEINASAQAPRLSPRVAGLESDIYLSADDYFLASYYQLICRMDYADFEGGLSLGGLSLGGLSLGGARVKTARSKANRAASIQRLAAARELQAVVRDAFIEEHGRAPTREEQKHAYAIVKHNATMAALSGKGGFSFADFGRLAKSAAKTAVKHGTSAVKFAAAQAAAHPELLQQGVGIAANLLGFGGARTGKGSRKVLIAVSPAQAKQLHKLM